MTGRELIIYILSNNLENEVIDFPSIIGENFLTMEQVAMKFDVGVETVLVWHLVGRIKGIAIGGKIYFPNDIIDPRENE